MSLEGKSMREQLDYMRGNAKKSRSDFIAEINSLERELVFTRDVIRHLVDEAKLTSSQYELCRQALCGRKP
jgi:hypothetical protein